MKCLFRFLSGVRGLDLYFIPACINICISRVSLVFDFPNPLLVGLGKAVQVFVMIAVPTSFKMFHIHKNACEELDK